jgi:GxGYxYP putative glycoside hydrolase C-terminal domain/GxGYxYP_N second domain/GxGYxYP third domain/GxGYxYP_N 1st domain
MNRRLLIFLSIIALAQCSLSATSADRFAGSWEFVPGASTEIDLYGTLALDIKALPGAIEIVHTWGGYRNFKDTVRVRTDGTVAGIPVTNRVFPTNVFMGLSMPVGSVRRVTARVEENGKRLRTVQTFGVLGSQGETQVTSTGTYELSERDQILTYRIDRSTRTTGLSYLLKRRGTRQAFVMKLVDDWNLNGGLPEQALLISLQGLANIGAPRLYFDYPADWPFTYTVAVHDFYQNKRYYSFKELKSTEEALDSLKQYVKGYVIWDKAVRTSLIVAFTAAGVEHGVVVNEDQIPLVEKAGLKPLVDLRGIFGGKSDAEIYSWAYKQYWDRCNRDFIVWLGGEGGAIMKPGVADWGVNQHVFFNDLSTKPVDSTEYALANTLLKGMHPMSMVMGWHSYAKDLERDFVTLTSHYGHRVEGLHTLPNLSFSSQVAPTEGFVYRNNHSVQPGKKYVPGKKVYIACIQTDGIGLGAWLKPGRGEIPYAWEVLMNYTWMAPAMLEYFYSSATPNDYFIGCLSGPGYMYPKAVPPALLTSLIEKSDTMMKKLDLRVFETMDYSQGATVEGNTDLTRKVVDAYYTGMPDAIGFVNGYAPSYTFTSRHGKPFISYDYYLSPTRPEADAVADLQELARINSARPYFLLLHVRESSDIKRVIGILDKLDSQFEVVPLDVFLTMAGARPTFKERFLEQQ